MTTATPTKPKARSALARLKEFETAWAEARDNASRLGSELGQKLAAFTALQDQRRRLIHTEPALVDHLGEPVSTKNDVGVVDTEIAALGDLGDLQAQVEHARALEQRAKQAVDGFLLEKLPEVVAELRPEAESIASDVNAAVEAAHAAANRYLDFHRRVTGYVHAVGGDSRQIPGLDEIAEMRRQLDGWDLPTPLPKLNR